MAITKPRTRSLGLIRNATLLDAREVSRLLGRSPAQAVTAADINEWLDRGHLLVLDLGDGTLGAVVRVAVTCERSAVDLLATDEERVPAEATEQRMCSVAHALCEAYSESLTDTEVSWYTPRSA